MMKEYINILHFTKHVKTWQASHYYHLFIDTSTKKITIAIIYTKVVEWSYSVVL